jgi:hypothetical protein
MQDFKLDLLGQRGVFHINVEVSKSFDDIANIKLVFNSLLSSFIKSHILLSFVCGKTTHSIWEEWTKHFCEE